MSPAHILNIYVVVIVKFVVILLEGQKEIHICNEKIIC